MPKNESYATGKYKAGKVKVMKKMPKSSAKKAKVKKK